MSYRLCVMRVRVDPIPILKRIRGPAAPRRREWRPAPRIVPFRFWAAFLDTVINKYFSLGFL